MTEDIEALEKVVGEMRTDIIKLTIEIKNLSSIVNPALEKFYKTIYGNNDTPGLKESIRVLESWKRDMVDSNKWFNRLVIGAILTQAILFIMWMLRTLFVG